MLSNRGMFDNILTVRSHCVLSRQEIIISLCSLLSLPADIKRYGRKKCGFQMKTEPFRLLFKYFVQTFDIDKY